MKKAWLKHFQAEIDIITNPVGCGTPKDAWQDVWKGCPLVAWSGSLLPDTSANFVEVIGMVVGYKLSSLITWISTIQSAE